MAARIAVVLVAVVAIAWLVVQERDHRLLVAGQKPAAPLAAAEQDLKDARLLNPDTAPDLILVSRLYGAGQVREARAQVEDILRREPDNIGAWNALAVIAAKDYPATARRAAAEVKRLKPR